MTSAHAHAVDLEPIRPRSGRDIAGDAVCVLQRLYADRLAAVTLYGSVARGDDHDRSDVDLLVRLAGARIDDYRETKRIYAVLYDELGGDAPWISVIVVGDLRLEAMYRPFRNEIDRDGIDLLA